VVVHTVFAMNVGLCVFLGLFDFILQCFAKDNDAFIEIRANLF
jgi:hypothetical protein